MLAPGVRGERDVNGIRAYFRSGRRGSILFQWFGLLFCRFQPDTQCLFGGVRGALGFRVRALTRSSPAPMICVMARS